ncbi:MAG: tripartite tricarboxylate transporter substrate binding protein [Burkholderiales bacterium]|nr:tripartite tricarboxylate transporter substrate binding protein [Burkholderiales bacterium]
MKTMVLSCIAGLVAATPVRADTYPSKPVRIVVPLSAGSGMDIIARWVTQRMADGWGQPVVVDNRPGAGGTVGTALIAKSKPDGHSLLASGSAHATNAALYHSLPYDSLGDFTPVASFASLVQVLVIAPSAGVRTLPDLMAAAKAKPGALTFASPGAGTGVHFTGEKFKLATGIDAVHVPFKGGPEAMTDVMMGRVTYWIPSLGTALPLIRGGKLLALGVTGRKRSSVLPDVPAIAESIPGFESTLWFGLWAPAHTPGSIVEKLAKDAVRALAHPALLDQLGSLVADPMPMTPAEFARFVRDETQTTVRIARVAGVKAQ